MNTDTAGFTEKLEAALMGYYNSFIHALPRFAVALVVLIIAYYISKYFGNVIQRRSKNKDYDPLFVNFLSKTVKVVIIVIGIIVGMNIIGLSGIAQGLLAGAGLGAFVFGFAFKDIAENFLAGMILAFNRPFSLNDTISVRELSGHVIALNFRTTHIKTFDEKDVFIPNSIVIKEPLTNFTRDGKIRLDFVVGIAYEDDITTAIATIQSTIRLVKDLKENTEAFAVVEELATSTVNLRVYFWANTLDYKRGVLEIRSEVISKVKEVLVRDGFSLPADIQEFKLYDKQEPLPINILNIKDARPN